MAAWQFWMDRGGTFTDIVAKKPDGSLVTHKLLSENPAHYKDAAIQGIRELLGLADDQVLPIELIDEVKMGTTVATNALLERKGEPTLLVTSYGLGDVLKIGYQTRPDIFALDIRLPEQLYVGVEEASERLLADGTIDRPLDEEGLAVRLIEWRKQGIESIAIAFAHGYRFPEHEKAAGRLARELGFKQVSLSHEVSPLVKLVPRGDTTVVDAYLSPILKRYVEQVDNQLSPSNTVSSKQKVPLYFMQSNGGLVDAHKFRGKDAILSGPAGGVVGMVETASDDGFDRIIGFDMGGTSTDVAHFNASHLSSNKESSNKKTATDKESPALANKVREYEREFETQVAGVRLRAPMMNIHTVAAGGGSIVKFADGRFQVGPESAGAFPGPACYRNGGPLTITDCNVLLGKVKAEYFPECFGPKRNQGLDFDRVKQQFEQLAESINAESDALYTAEQIAQGFLTIAIGNMANAVKKISLQRGYDVGNYVLNAFGGAGAQHACLVAESLGMKQVYLHPFAGVLSAYGIGLANERWLGEESLQLEVFNSSKSSSSRSSESINACAVLDEIELRQVRLQQKANASISKVSISRTSKASAQNPHSFKNIQDFWRIHIKYKGTDTPLLLSLPNNLDMTKVAAEFHQLHQQTFGFSDPERTLILEALQLERVAGGDAQEYKQDHYAGELKAIAHSDMTCSIKNSVNGSMKAESKTLQVPVYRREQLPKNTEIKGPALIAENNSTIVIEPSWVGEVIESGALILTYQAGISLEGGEGSLAESIESKSAVNTSRPDAIQLEVFNNLFMFVAEQMGFVLEKTAASVNIKERLDFSCALFDKNGELVANAPHIPVHLGSMSESIKVVINNNPNMKPGDAFVLNTPYNGGTHLPDITIVKPVFITANDENKVADFYVAARGHHADVGGITPGSMPARSQHINEEGILLDNLCLVKEGEFQVDMITAALSDHEFPARNIPQNIADLKAQLAACEKGAQELTRLSGQYGLVTLHAYMGHVQDNAENTLKDCLKNLDSGSFEYPMDDGSLIKVAITIDKDLDNKSDKENCRAKVDFTGTSDQHSGNFNAPTSVAKAAVLYVFRCLVAKSMPLNAGFFRALDIIVPEGSMLAPQYPAAVVSGNVETAQYIVDTLLGALGIMAASQGTNNNFTFGDEEFQYYETLCGGAGATQSNDGASGVHSHMTNSRLTDVEILEQRFPVMLEHFAIRPCSGGLGEHKGGDGIERHIRFLKQMSATIISGHRQVPTFGMAGGESGKVGMNFVQRFVLDKQGIPVPKLEFLKGCTDIQMNRGDVFCIHTPGGGGYGEHSDKKVSKAALNDRDKDQ